MPEVNARPRSGRIMASRLLDTTLRQVLRKIGLSELARSAASSRTASDPLRRRFEGGQLKQYPSDFFIRQDAALRPLLSEVLRGGGITDTLFLRPELSVFDERVVEYPVALASLIQASVCDHVHVLDAGCVLNNPSISEYVSKLVSMVWFLNASFEPLHYEENAAYILSDIRRHRLSTDLGYHLVTCLSTLEHIGMDNTRYGGNPAEFSGELKNPEKLALDALHSLLPLVKPGGKLLVSVPFGPFEYLYLHGRPRDPIYYTFNERMLSTLADGLGGFEPSTSIYKVVPQQGWVRTSIHDQDILRYGDNCAGAGAVAFIEATRVGRAETSDE